MGVKALNSFFSGILVSAQSIFSISKDQEFAEVLEGLDRAGTLPKYKALLQGTRCESLAGALRLAGRLKETDFDPGIHNPIDAAKAELELSLGQKEAAFLELYVDLWGYGTALP